MKTYTGIIDSEGLDSFALKPCSFPFIIRAMANPQRKPIVYECQPTEKQEQIIAKLFEKGNYSIASYAVKDSRKFKIIWKGSE